MNIFTKFFCCFLFLTLLLGVSGSVICFGQPVPVVINNTNISGILPNLNVRSQPDTTSAVITTVAINVRLVADSIESGGIAGNPVTSQTTNQWYRVSLPGTVAPDTGYVAAGVLFTNPVCIAPYFRVLAPEIFIRNSIDTLPGSNITIGSANAKVFQNQYYAIIDSGYDITGHIWYEILLPNNCSQTYGWVSSYQGGALVQSFTSGANGLPTPTGLTSSGITSDGATLNWAMSYYPYNTTFNIYSGGSLIGAVTNSSITMGTPTNTTLSLSSGTFYSLNVTAYANGCFSDSSSYTSFTTTGTSVSGPLVNYQYWFDNDYSSAVTQTISSTDSVYYFDNSIATSTLTGGLHIINIRAQNNVGVWSVATSSYFYKKGTNVAKYQYWFDNNYGGAITLPTGASDNVFSLNSEILGSTLSTGIHILNMRFQDNNGLWSVVSSQYFYKQANSIVNYQYWYDNNYYSNVTQTITPVASFSLNSDIVTGSLSSGIHFLQFRSMDNLNNWSAVTNNLFYQNTLLTAYRYWINSNYDSAHTVTLSIPVGSTDLNLSIPCSFLPYGRDTFYFEVENNLGEWSAVTADTFKSIPGIPAVSIASNTTHSVCAGTTVTFTPTPTLGGTSPVYKWKKNSIIADTGASYSYIPTNGDIISCVLISNAPCSNPDTAISNSITMTVNPIPATIIGTTTVCVGSITILSDSTSSGLWSSGSTGIATIGTTGIVSGVSVGTTTITYTTVAGCIINTTVTVNPIPNAGSIIGIGLICAGSVTNLTDTAWGGTWSSGAAGIATVGSTGETTGIANGTADISYTVTNSCGSISAISIVTVNSSVSPIMGSIEVCAGSEITLSDVGTGGTWSSGSTGTATIGSTGIVTGVMIGTTTISYTLTNICGTSTVTQIITVNPSPVVGTIYGLSGICVDASATLTDGVSGGVWSSTNGNALISSDGDMYGLMVGIDTAVYTFTNSCGTATATKTVTINPLPNAGSINGPSTVCIESSITLSNAVSGGVWVSSNTTIATIGSTGITTAINIGSDTIIYTNSNSCGTATAIHVVIVNPLPDAGAITGADTVCIGNTISFSDSIAGGSWTSTNSNSFVSSEGSVYGITTGIDTIKYTITSICGTATTQKIIHIINCSTDINNATDPSNVITFYPNPTNGKISIKATVSGVFNVYSLDGSKLGEYKITEGLTIVTLPNDLASGIYMSKFIGNDGKVNLFRIVKE